LSCHGPDSTCCFTVDGIILLPVDPFLQISLMVSVMARFSTFLMIFSLVAVPLPAAEDGRTSNTLDNWPQWRGPMATGVAPHADPPVEWSEQKNIRWKTPIPGRGHSTPVVWNDRIFMTAAIPVGEELEPRYSKASGTHDNLPVTHRHAFVVIAVGRTDGSIIWQTPVNEELPEDVGHVTASLASASPVTDGESVYAFFGSYGLFCLDLDGNLHWEKRLGRMQTKHGHGEGASPALHGRTLIVNWDHEGQSFVLALDKNTGVQKWKNLRDEPTSWATPIVVEHANRHQVIISGTNRIRSHDVETGELIWECGGMSANVVASPVAGGGMVIAGSSYEKQAMLAIRLEGAWGDITGTDRVVWTRGNRTPYVPSPMYYGNFLYFHSHYQNVLCRVNALTGEEKNSPFRLPGIGNVYASPVGAAGRIYVTDLQGTTLVFSHGDTPDFLSVNRLEDSFSASAALVGHEIFLRGEQYLYCIAEHPGS
jgi:outer membrane protein assembly factor BamB